MAGKSTYTEDQRREAVDLARHEGTRAASARTGVSGAHLRRWLRAEGVRGKPRDTTPTPPSAPPEESREDELTGDGWTISLRSRTVATFDQLVAACGVDLAVWAPEHFRCKSYQMSYKPPATREGDEPQWTRMHDRAHAETITMYAVVASFARRVAEIAVRAALAEVVAEAASRVVRAPLAVVAPARSGCMLGLSIADAHNGKLCWGLETGGADYDLKLAVAAQDRAFETLLARSAHLDFERILLVLGNDGLHVDSNANTTTKGTPQDTDSRAFKTFGVTWRAYVDQIERARQRAPVLVVVMPGNHDAESMLHVGEVLTAWFRGDPRVEIDNRPLPRKYVAFGRNLIGVQHGDAGKPAQWASLMPVEAPALWAGSRHRTILTGHLHVERMEQDEVNGVKVWRVPSLAPADHWHAKNGYVGARQAALAFHWHADEGLIGTAAYTAPPLLHAA